MTVPVSPAPTGNTAALRGSALLRRLDQLTTPSAALTTAEDIRTARMLAYLSFALALIFALSTVISIFTSIFFPDPAISLGVPGTLLISATCIGFFGAYRLGITENYTRGAWLMLAVIYVFATGFLLLYPNLGGGLVLAYIVPVVISTIILNSAGTIRVFVISLLLAAVILPLLGIPIVGFAINWGVQLAVTIIMVLLSLLREEDLRQVRRLRELEAAEAERLHRELELARSVQQSMLPKHLPTVPQLDLAAYWQPAYEASGDFYDVFYLNQSHSAKIGIVVCDVAGKGISSALVMSATRAALRAESVRTQSPAEVLGKVNELLAASIPAGLFVTLFYGVYDPVERSLNYASAGHPHPFWWSGSHISELENYGMPLGLVPESEYQDVVVNLTPGDSVFIYTDGLVEALNPRRQMYGFDTAQRTVEQFARRRVSADELVTSTLHDMTVFSEGEQQQDDVTIVVLKVKEIA
ncbi:MAG: SpoIIE family protein phosphatase [Anaerolinea sp.]|nr:SpoIIE family protein phosphatase [Anaerolinea sp.]